MPLTIDSFFNGDKLSAASLSQTKDSWGVIRMNVKSKRNLVKASVIRQNSSRHLSVSIDKP